MPIIKKGITGICRDFMQRYGRHVNEDRAMPAAHDGMKPVHRRILWALHEIGGDRLVKSARVVGDVLGKYHPHGDTACYGALVSLVNQPTPLVHGEGNWGTIFKDPAASMRYTNCKLTPLGQSLFDPYYAAAVKLVPNFDDTRTEPLLLMCPLPLLLLGCNMGIGVGTTGYMMPCTLESVKALTKAAYKAHSKGTKLTSQQCADTLVFTCLGGGVVDGQYEERLNFMESGAGSLVYSSVYEEESPYEMAFTAFAPTDILKRLAKIAEMEGIASVDNVTSIENGYRIKVVLKRLPKDKLKSLKKAVAAELSARVALNLNVTLRRKTDKGVETRNVHVSVPEFMDKWVAWQIRCDKAATKHALALADKEISRIDLLTLAVQNRDLIKRLLDKGLTNEALVVALAKALEVEKQDADFILNLKIRQLNALEEQALENQKAAVLEQKAGYEARLENPYPSLVKRANSV